jgi:hypothetical protein
MILIFLSILFFLNILTVLNNFSFLIIHTEKYFPFIINLLILQTKFFILLNNTLRR